MAQSLAKNYIHLVFSTKNRKSMIRETELPVIHAYIAGVLNKMGCPTLVVGGTTNHVHILFVLNKNVALAKVVGEMKHNVTKWIKLRDPFFYRFFAWQEGYGAFSVSQSMVEPVMAYIKNQHDHHRHISFKEELKAFLDKYGVEYNEEYL